jgi:nucleoside-diphosphate-sugar epimerase
LDVAAAEDCVSRILVTGATGFVGQGLLARLTADARPFRSAVRRAGADGDTIGVGEIGPDTDWTAALDGIDTIVHLAGRAHVFGAEADALAEFRRVNAAGTARLAKQAERAGIRRFVLVSSVKAAADVGGRTPLSERDPPKPTTPYGLSKLESERALLAAAGKMQTVILRPPLVYGPGVRANFHALLRLVDRGVALPLSSVRNLRSLIARENLVDAIVTALDSPDAAGGTFYVSDGAAISTPDLLRGLASALGKQARLFPFPSSLLRLGAFMLGRAGTADSILRSLVVDDIAFRTATGWKPPVTRQVAFSQVAAWYKQAKGTD